MISRDVLLDRAQFVTDKFAKNHEPWKYDGESKGLKHIRYDNQLSGSYSLKNRLRQFIRKTTVGYVKPSAFEKLLKGDQRLNWFRYVKVMWDVYVIPEDNKPDATVNGSIHAAWDEDATYITLFGPYVGRQVLKFLREDPENPHAVAITEAMTETWEQNWGNEK